MHWRPEKLKWHLTKTPRIWVQRARRGWSDPDSWGFDYYLAGVIIGGVERIKRDSIGWPGVYYDEYGYDMPVEAWDAILEAIADGFRAYRQMQDFEVEYKTPEWDLAERQFARGKQLFIDYYQNLWD